MESVTLLDEDGVRRALSRIAYEIIERVGDLNDLVIVGIRTRGWYLATRLAGRISEMEGLEVPHLELDVSPYRDDRFPGWQGRMDHSTPMLEWNQQIDQRRVVLVDDVLFTGRTVRAALDALTQAARPALIQLAVLVDRGHRELPIRPDYVGKNIPTASNERVQVLVKEVDGDDAVRLFKLGGVRS